MPDVSTRDRNLLRRWTVPAVLLALALCACTRSEVSPESAPPIDPVGFAQRLRSAASEETSLERFERELRSPAAQQMREAEFLRAYQDHLRDASRREGDLPEVARRLLKIANEVGVPDTEIANSLIVARSLLAEEGRSLSAERRKYPDLFSRLVSSKPGSWGSFVEVEADRSEAVR